MVPIAEKSVVPIEIYNILDDLEDLHLDDITLDEEPDVLFEDSKDIEFITEDYTSYQLELNSLIDSLLISKKIRFSQNNLLKVTAKAEMVLKSILI